MTLPPLFRESSSTLRILDKTCMKTSSVDKKTRKEECAL
jgi:hypothetical protein